MATLQAPDRGRRRLLMAAGLAATTLADRASGAETAPAPATLDRHALRSDVAVLREVFETLHPGLYRYNTAAQIDAAFGRLMARFDRDLSPSEAFVAFSQFTAGVRCGHTHPNPYNQTKAVAQAVYLGTPRLPFTFRWVGTRMIATSAVPGKPRVLPGTEVFAINGHPVAQILRTLMTIARADGSNDGKRVASLEVTANERFGAFDLYFPLLFPWPGNEFVLSARAPRGHRIESFAVAGVTDADRKAATLRETDPNAALWTLRWLDEHTAWLPMPDWVAYKSQWDWQAQLNADFDQMIDRGAEALVIDLRGNEGGSDIGDGVIARLATRELPAQNVARRVRYRSVPAALRPVLDTWDPSFFDWGDAAVGPPVDDYFRLQRPDDDALKPTPRSDRPFRGKVIVIVGPENSSATFQFAQAMQRHRLGTLLGRTTGGNRRGINGGAFFFVRLPGSKIEIDLPLIGQFTQGRQPDAGVAPDRAVPINPADIVSGRDTDLEVAWRLLGRTRPLYLV